MNSKEIFNGFSAETFRFLLEIGFNNNADWFEANRKRYEQFVRDPMRRLAAALMPTALDTDGNFNPSINASVSRIRRDTRFTKDKSPYRDHMWIGFRYPRTRISEGCTLWFEIKSLNVQIGFQLSGCIGESVASVAFAAVNKSARVKRMCTRADVSLSPLRDKRKRMINFIVIFILQQTEQQVK